MSENNAIQLIKKSIALRAKYRADQGHATPTIRVYAPPLVVPHAKNRGGDPVKSLRTIQLSGTIACEGCDPIEGSSNAVAVLESETELEYLVGGARSAIYPRLWSFQGNFERQIKADPDMAGKVNGINAIIGSLSHSHFNCTMRNMLAGKKGCGCAESAGVECKCRNRPIVSNDGTYCMKRVANHDGSWAELCLKGIPWEILSPQMDAEEPEGALIISLALNKKNEAAMKTSHTEVMNTLVGLCKPSPDAIDGQVPFDPVRAKMVELYGAAVDHPDFVQAFRLVLDAGGHDSPHMQDLHEFTKVHVNPKLRKMRFEAYAVVAPWPTDFPRLKNACLKWSWFQPPSRGWCPLPPNIQHRLQKDSKYKMSKLMEDIEDALCFLSKRASTVVGGKNLKQKTKWIGEVDIGIITKICAVPKSVEVGGRQLRVSEQEVNLELECAEFIATKLLQLHDFKIGNQEQLALQSRVPGNQLLGLCVKKLNTPDFVTTAKEASAKAKEDKGLTGQKDKSTVVEELVPKVIAMDTDGKPTSSHETKMVEVVDAEVIPWRTWLSLQEDVSRISYAKSCLVTGAFLLNGKFDDPPVAMIRKLGKVSTKATKDIGIGELVAPLKIQKMSSICTDDDRSVVRHPHAVTAAISWPVSEQERECGVESESHELNLVVQPEFKLPKRKQGEGLEWSMQDAASLFWGIKRQEKVEDEWNCEIVHQDVMGVLASTDEDSRLRGMGVSIAPSAETYTATVPIIVNVKK